MGMDTYFVFEMFLGLRSDHDAAIHYSYIYWNMCNNFLILPARIFLYLSNTYLIKSIVRSFYVNFRTPSF